MQISQTNQSRHYKRNRTIAELRYGEKDIISPSTLFFSRTQKGIPRKGKAGIPKVSVTEGGVAIVYTEVKFNVEDAEIESPEGIKAAWVMLTPKNKEFNSVSQILVGGIYIAPDSKHKHRNTDHIIEKAFFCDI